MRRVELFSVAAALSGVRAREGKAQATALYNMAYYAGGALIGWIGGFFYAGGGWLATGSFCIFILALLGAFALVILARQEQGKG